MCRFVFSKHWWCHTGYVHLSQSAVLSHRPETLVKSQIALQVLNARLIITWLYVSLGFGLLNVVNIKSWHGQLRGLLCPVLNLRLLFKDIMVPLPGIFIEPDNWLIARDLHIFSHCIATMIREFSYNLWFTHSFSGYMSFFLFFKATFLRCLDLQELLWPTFFTVTQKSKTPATQFFLCKSNENKSGNVQFMRTFVAAYSAESAFVVSLHNFPFTVT